MPAAILDLLDLLKSVKVDGHQQYEALEIFHLRWTADIKRLDYLTLDEALETKCIEVVELSQHGQVPQIKIINRSDRMVFLMAGEQLVLLCYKKGVPQKGQPERCRSRTLAMV